MLLPASFPAALVMPGWVAGAEPRTKAGAAPRRRISEEQKEKGAGQDDFLGSYLPAVPGAVRRLLRTVKSQA